MWLSRRIPNYLFSAQLVYLLLALACIMAARWPAALQQGLQWLDSRTLALSYGAAPAPAAPLRIAIAEIPALEMRDFSRSPMEHDVGRGLMALSAQGITTFVFLREPLWADQLARLGPLGQLPRPAAETLSPAQAELLAQLDQLVRWQAFRQQSRGHWFLPWGLMPEASGKPVDFQSGVGPWRSGPLRALLGYDRPVHWQSEVDRRQGPYQFLGAGAQMAQPLWWQLEGFQHIQAAPLLLLSATQSLGAFRWADGVLQADNNWRRPVAADGRVAPDWRLAPVPLSLAEVRNHLADYDVLLVAEAGDLQPLMVATVANTLAAGHYPVAPAWALLWSPALVLLLWWLTRPVWRASLWLASLLTLLVTGALVAVQAGAHIYYQWWLACGVAIAWLWLSLCWKLIWSLVGLRQARLAQSWRRAWQKLLRADIGTGKLAEAENQLLELSHYRDEPWQLDLTCELAQAYEKQRRYEQAEKLYTQVLARSRNHGDVRNRLARLRELSGGHGSLESTLIIDEQIINKPVLGRYEIQKELGRGAMGVVYLGRDPKISRLVAIKTLHYKNFDSAQLADVKARFFREAEAAGRLSHPNIVSVFDVGEEDDLAYIAMDYVPGHALNYYTHPKRLLPVPLVYGLVAKAADALFYAHRHQIVHRDIKPGNLLYDAETGRLKVSDFGIARLVDNSKTRTGDVMGSPLYMSPEQLKGAKVTEAADIYSLGVTLYQLLTGKLPYDGDTLANLTYQILQGKHPSVRSHREDLPPSATRITNKALQKEPCDRFENAREMADALRKAMARDFDKA